MMPELPFYENLPMLPFNKGGMGGFVDWQACIVKPLCAHPARRALAGSQVYPVGLPDEEHISGWANMQSNNYWSSTTYANNTDNAWNVNMNNGNVNANNKTNNKYVWPVRAGEWLDISIPSLTLALSLQGRGDEDADSPPLTGGGKGEGDLFSFENLYRCYLRCRKNKRNTINALRFEINAEENLFRLSEELKSKTYRPSRSVCFIVERPKMREIVAADFRDRVVHHLLVERLEAIYEPIFINDSYACRKNKGLHRAVERVRIFIRRGSENGRKRLYYLHLDIKNFFMTIDKEVLYSILEKKVKDENLLYLARVIIFHRPTDNCIIKGKRYLVKRLPPHKSLFHAPENKGLPVGNLTSQFFANVYLNEIDQYVKHTLKCRYYVRYCDDFLILDESPERLNEAKEQIRGFAFERLSLSLNDKYQSILPVSNGIDFLGYIIRHDYMLVRRRVVNNLKTKLSWFEKRLIENIAVAGKTFPPIPEIFNRESRVFSQELDSGLRPAGMTTMRGRRITENIRVFKYDYELLEKLKSVIASYLGHLKWADTYSLRNAIFERYGFLKEYFSFDDEKVSPLYRYCEIFPSVRSQYLYYACMFRGCAVFFQVGCFYEFYEEIKDEVIAVLNLKRIQKSKRGVRYGFPVRFEEEYAKRLVNRGIPVIIIRETDRYVGRVKERLPVMKIIKKEE